MWPLRKSSRACACATPSAAAAARSCSARRIWMAHLLGVIGSPPVEMTVSLPAHGRYTTSATTSLQPGHVSCLLTIRRPHIGQQAGAVGGSYLAPASGLDTLGRICPPLGASAIPDHGRRPAHFLVSPHSPPEGAAVIRSLSTLLCRLAERLRPVLADVRELEERRALLDRLSDPRGTIDE